ncbi:monooxygenase [Hydrogenophaga sp. Root209]|uniref:FAD-dependent monooxygenase n=1 Tax=Hydrogenophaga sp. Root209 TaxID=1736490 RepID=UPI000700E034|nr:FAD-dependent monooxygenase [Hydrogenophaga sp. Root209]KRC12353.1 monooxygenase [Hydrogenophaga sp. Root209]
MRVVVVGAGIGGLTAALALMRRGFDVQVLEQARELREVGAGLQISPNGNRVLDALGLTPALSRIAAEPAGKKVRLWNTGQTRNLFDLGATSRERYGFPYLTVHRADLHRALIDGVKAMKPDAIKTGVRIDHVEQCGAEVIVRSGDATVAVADVVVGADGVHSQVRQCLIGEDRPSFSGIIAWRGVIEASRLPDHLRQPYGYNWVGPGAHVIHYPMRRGELVNFVGAVEQQGWEVESWSEVGSVEECLSDFKGWHEDVQTLIRSLHTPYRWALMGRETLPRWSYGRVALLGDACHPTLPFLAQGAVMALEDGLVLARCLEAWKSDPELGLQHFERARIDRTSRIVNGSAANAKRFHNPQLAHADGAASYVDEQWSEERVKERYEWLFEYKADTVPL